jgi:outer membrane receptor protein involved in Fe transport
MQRSVLHPRAVRTVLALILVPFLLAAAAPGKKTFDVSAGDAEAALREFTRQAGVPLVFDVAKVGGVRTAAVRGDYTPREALDLMFAGTRLVAAQDAKTGALTLQRDASDPNGAGALPATNGVRPAPSLPGDAETVELSPFVVNVSQDQGYVATSTLSGTRLNTALELTPASISEFTPEFLADINANNTLDAVEYAVGFAEENSQSNSNAQQFNDINIVSRGVPRSGGARSVSRNYFVWYLNGDSYNTERLSFSRGPNSVLFGIGDPGGMINTSTKQARFKTATELAFKTDSNGSWRAHLDHNHRLRDNLGVRVNLLHENRKTWREVEHYDQTRLHLAGNWRPWRKTTVRAEFERGLVDQVRARPWSGRDRFSPWVDAGRPAYNRPTQGNTYPTGVNNIGANPYLVFDTATNSWMNWQRFARSQPAASGPVKLRDPSVLPFEAVISGPSSSTDFDFSTWSVYLEQELARNLMLELAYNEQTEDRDVRQAVVHDQIALNIDPNVTLPNGGTNPNFGKFYIEGQAQWTLVQRTTENLRATLAYEWDSGSPWFGRHRWVGLASSEVVDQANQRFSEANLTPASGVALLSNTANGIRRRTYLDFNGGKRAFDQDPWQPQTAVALNSNGVAGTVTPGFFRNRWRPQKEDTTSYLLAGQSTFLRGDRLTLTYGLRRDELEQQSFVETVDRTTGTVTAGGLGAVNAFEGDTLTSGAVVRITPWLLAFANYSENFSPQSALNLYSANVGNVEAEGFDYGLRLVLFDRRLHASLGRFRTASTNRAGITAFDYRAPINRIWEAIDGSIGGPNEIFEGFNDVQDFASEGYEFEVNANLSRGLSVKANFGILEGKVENYNPFTRGYIAANRALWQQNASRVVPSTGETVATQLGRIDAIAARHDLAQGREAENNRKHSFNIFGKYQFQSGPLKPWSIGGGARYRGKNITAYAADGSAVYGNSYWVADAFASYRMRVWRDKVAMTFQLNVQNLLDNDELIVTETTGTGAIVDYIFQAPRTLTLSATFKF